MPVEFDAPAKPAKEIWNLLDEEIKTLLLVGVRESLESAPSGSVGCSIKDGKFYTKTNDDMDYDLFIIDSGLMGIWVNKDVGEEKMNSLSQRFSPLVFDLYFVNPAILQNVEKKLIESGGEIISPKGLMKKIGTDNVFHLPHIIFDCLKGLEWAKLIEANRPLINALIAAPQGVSVKTLLEGVPHDLTLNDEPGLWL